MSNVIAINAAAKESIAAARATTDDMLLTSIAKGDRTAMHVLYSRHNVRVYRFVLRMVRDTTVAVPQAVLGSVFTALLHHTAGIPTDDMALLALRNDRCLPRAQGARGAARPATAHPQPTTHL